MPVWVRVDKKLLSDFPFFHIVQLTCFTQVNVIYSLNKICPEMFDFSAG